MLLRELGKAWRLVLGLPKTLIFNFRYLPFTQACRLPVLVSHRVKFVHLGGTVELTQPRFGTVRLGLPGNDLFLDTHPGLWKVTGKVRFGAGVRMGTGVRLVCEGEMAFGDCVQINAGTSLFCAKRITVGDRALFSWNIVVMDNDFHELRDSTGKCLNPPDVVTIGRDCWLGVNTTILKGVGLAPNTVVGAGAVVTGEFVEPNCVIAGNPAKVVRRGVFRGTLP